MLAKFAFISRHVPTPEQIRLAESKGIELVHVGDCDAFDPKCLDAWFPDDYSKRKYKGLIAVHPAVFLTAIGKHITFMGVFENRNRAAEGEKPQFVCSNLHLWNVFGNDYGSPDTCRFHHFQSGLVCV